MSHGWEESAKGWIAQMDNHDYIRHRVMDKRMHEVMGDVSGLKVLDLGCGEGRFCRQLSDRGAKVTGFDLTQNLLARGKELGGGTDYFRGDAEVMALRSESFDVAVSYVMMLDVPDYRTCIRETARVLKPGGRLFYSNLQAYCTCTPDGWVKDEDGNRLYMPIDDYSYEHGSWVAWGEIRIANYHRPLAAYMSAFLEVGFRLLRFEEPLPDWSEWGYDQFYARAPWVHLMEWVKE